MPLPCITSGEDGSFSVPELVDCGTTLTSTAATFSWNDPNPAPGRIYQPYVNGGVAGSGTTGNSVSVTGLPSDGSIIVKQIQYSDDGGATFQVGDTCTCTAVSQNFSVPMLQDCGTVLTSTSATFTWSDPNAPPVRIYQPYINGGVAGGITQANSVSVTGLPNNGSTIIKQIQYSDDSGATWQIGSACECTAVIETNTLQLNDCGQTLTDSQLNVSWTTDPNAPSDLLYDLWIDLGSGFVDQGTAVQHPGNTWPTITVPTDGRTITKRLYFWTVGDRPPEDGNGQLITNDFVECTCTAAIIESPDHEFFSDIQTKQINPEHCLDDDIDFLGEYLLQNPDVCAWTLDSGQQCIFKEDLPVLNGTNTTVFTNAQLLFALQNSTPNTTITGNGGTFTLPLSTNVPVSNLEVKDMTIVPSGPGGNLLTINGQNVTFNNVTIELNNAHMQNPIRVNGADFTFVNSTIQNLVGTGTVTVDCISVKADRADIICSTFRNVRSANGVVRFVRWQGVTIQGGYCANNTVENLQSTNVNTTNPAFVGDDADSFVTQQVTFTTPLYILANRGVNMGKRMVKLQAGNVVVQSNIGDWRDANGPLGARRQRAIVSDLYGFNNRVKNNYGISRYQTTGGETHGFEFGHNNPQSGNVVWSCNVYEVNHPGANLDYAFSVRNYSSGNPMYPPNSEMLDNVSTGSGTVDWAYWDRDTPGGNNFSGFPNSNTGTNVPQISGLIRNT